ncbi:MAG: hypothetical protein A3H93_13960 [Rhodocyclales bacterium RIFCSPLOWO2_02_FULL_63_24]|nr:MAG: hypothetical protein A3H93_13960 [Rhodocyclales bacterium RIFCSPLOWO2_02_FULL_63_24]
MAETRRVIPIAQAKATSPEDTLLRDGWVRQTTIGEPRLSEIVQNYKTMGFEVHVEEFKTEGDGCNTCFDAGQEMGFMYGTVYVRKRSGPASEDELF